MFSVIFTFADFQLIYVLTRGGPANATHVFATYAFDIAMGAGPVRPGRVDRAVHGAAAGADHPRHGDLHAAVQVMMAEIMRTRS